MDYRKIFSRRLKRLRTDRNLSQKEFGKELALFVGRPKAYSVSTISSWEMAFKFPETFDAIIALADYFGVTVDYLIGRTDQNEKSKSELVYPDDFINEISAENLKLYHNKPVYVIYPRNNQYNQWGIYDKDGDQFYCKSGIIQNNSHFRYFATDADSDKEHISRRNPLSMSDMINAKMVYIDYFAGDYDTNRKYSGWYHHTGDGELMSENGLILPYSGLGSNFSAYKN